MNINTNYLIRGLSAVYSQLEVSKKNTLVLLKNLLIAKNTGEKQTKTLKNNELNNNDILKRNAPIMRVENHLSRISSRDRLANNTLKMTRYHLPLSEPHHDLTQLLAQPLREFQLSPTEAYNKWIVSPATSRPNRKISSPPLRPAPPPPTQVQKRPTASSGTLVIRNTVNAEQQVTNTPALQQKQSHAPLIRAQSQPITTHQQQQASLMSELSAVLAKRNAINTNGNQSKHLSALTPQHTKNLPVYVKEFNEIF